MRRSDAYTIAHFTDSRELMHRAARGVYHAYSQWNGKKIAILAVNASCAYVISVDLNSGLNGDTGAGNPAIRSDLTVSIGYYKTGMFKGDAPRRIGKLVNADIGIELVD